MAIGLTASFPLFAIALPLFELGGGGNGMVNVSMRSLIHHRVPDRIRGRVFAAYSGVLSTASAVATGLGGVFVETIGARGTLFLAGAGRTAVALVGAVLYRRLPLDQRTAAGSPRSR